MSNTKEYKVYLQKELPSINDGKRGLFHIVTTDNTIPVVITISGTFLSTWHRDGDTAYGATLMEVGSLLTECMFLYGTVHDMTLVTHDFPQDFQVGEEGYQKMIAHIQGEIDRKNLD